MGNHMCANAEHGSKARNCPIGGHGGVLEIPADNARKVLMCISYDYEPANYEKQPWGGLLAPLTGSVDGGNFAALGLAAGAEVHEYCDNPKRANKANIEWHGHPNKDTILKDLKAWGSKLDEHDTFIFFYSGHGKQSDNNETIDADEEAATELCMCDQSGEYNPMKDAEIQDVLLNNFNERTQILFVTDCCQCGTICNLDTPDFGDRPICHVAAVKDAQYAIDWGVGGGLTTCIMEAIEDIVAEDEDEDDNRSFPITRLFNAAYEKFKHACAEFGDNPKEQHFSFERTPDHDPDTFIWPLVPPEGWTAHTLLDDCNVE